MSGLNNEVNDDKPIESGNPEKLQIPESKHKMFTFIISGRIRIKIYKCLLVKPYYAYEIAKKERLIASAVIRSMKSLENKGIVECLNPESSRQKYFQLTMEGVSLKKYFEKYMELD